MFRAVLLTGLFIMTPPPAYAQEDPAVCKAKATLALAKASRERMNAQTVSRDECLKNYESAVIKATHFGRPLVLWVGMECSEAVEFKNALPDAVHAHLLSWNGSSAPRVVIADAKGASYGYPKEVLDAKAAREIERLWTEKTPQKIPKAQSKAQTIVIEESGFPPVRFPTYYQPNYLPTLSGFPIQSSGSNCPGGVCPAPR